MDSKIDLRKKAKSIRKTLNLEALSNEMIEQVRNSSLYREAKNVLLYCPMQYEINLLELLNDNKNFYLPKVFEDKLWVCPFNIGDKLEKSCLNINEPCSNPISPDMLDLALVPALMADAENFRLGYGGGFYDRFLAKNPHIKTIVVVAKELFVQSLPHDEFDISVDEVLISVK